MTLRSAARRGHQVVRGRWVGLRRGWRRGRLDVRDLPSGARGLVRIALVTMVACAAIIVARAVRVGPLGPTIQIPSQFLAATSVADVPVATLLIASAGMCVATAGLGYANQRTGPRLSRLALVAIGLLGLALSSQLVGAGRDLAGIESLVASGSLPWLPASEVIVAGGWIGIGCALVALGLTLSRSTLAGPWGGAAAAAAPFALTGILVAAVGYESFDLGAAAQDRGLPQVLTASSYVAPALVAVAGVVGFWLFPLGLWQVVTWARASRREVGRRIAAREARWPWLLAALLTLKLGWLLLGYARRLPTVLGGGAPVWEAALGDGVVAWGIAAGFAILVGWWLATPGRARISERGFTPAAILVVVGFSAVTVVMSLALIALPVAGLLPGTSRIAALTAACATTWPSEAIGNAAQCLIDAATDHQTELTILVQLGTLVVATVVAGWLWRRPRWRSTVIFLVVVVVWVAPRVPDALGALLGLPPAASVAPELATFDTVLTLVIAILAIAWYAGAQRGAPPTALLLALVVTTLLVHAGTLVPTGGTTILFFLALLFPIAYDLLFDSETLNRRHVDRPAKVIEALGIRVGVLSLVALSIALGSLGSGEVGAAELGRVLFAVPFSALLVGATLSRRQAPLGEPECDPPGLPVADAATTGPAPAIATRVRPRTLVAGIVGAAVVLSALVEIGAMADRALAALAISAGASASPAASAPIVTPSPAPSVTPVQRFVEFGVHTTSTHGLIKDELQLLGDHLASGVNSLSTDGAAFERIAAAERGWTASHPPADCYATAAGAWGVAMVRLGALGTQIAAVTDVNDPATQTAVLGVINDYVAADGTFLDVFVASTTACSAAPAPLPSPSH